MTTLIPAWPAWPLEVVRGVADVLAHTQLGLTGSQIGDLLGAARVPDVAPLLSKRDRLYAALAGRQARDGAANCTVAFITAAMRPVRDRYVPGDFSDRQDQLNEVLVFIGHRINDEGKVAKGPAAATLSEAARRANSIRTELRRRGSHELVLRYCLDEVLAKDAFHAGLEAVKGLAQRLRDMSGLHGDGARVVDDALSLGSSGVPKLAINSLGTPSEQDEQKGFAMVLKGLFALYRNPLAHDPRALRVVTDEELLELLTTLSMAHRRLDGARTI